jgi:hypothetical protein
MAYVAISDKLMQAVSSHMDRMERKELQALPEPKLELEEVEYDIIERKMWGEHYPLKTQIPADWLRKCNSVNVILRKQPTETDTLQYHHITSVTTSRVLIVPPSGHKFAKTVDISTSYDGTVNRIGICASHFDAPKFTEARARIATISEVQQRWNKVQQDVRKFIEEAKSLNEAVKLWPQVSLYIPAEYLNKVNEKREVSKSASRAAEILKEIDTNAAIASATLSRMATNAA